MMNSSYAVRPGLCDSSGISAFALMCAATAGMLLPDYFVLKPMHSAFFQTPLEILLHYLGATSLILTGLATNSCIVCTAHDAKMRNFSLYVPADCSAARTRREHEQAIEHIQEMTCASVVASPSLRVGDLRSVSRRRKKPKA
jgi:isochorismate hydrolase